MHDVESTFLATIFDKIGSIDDDNVEMSGEVRLCRQWYNGVSVARSDKGGTSVASTLP